VLRWQDKDALFGASLLVNTTSLGMTGQPPLEIDLAPLPARALVTDIVYSPLETGLLAMARARGHAVVDGLGMLLHQGRPGFRAWFGVDPEVSDALRATVLAGLG
jgi:shikimate dehydrogenase